MSRLTDKLHHIKDHFERELINSPDLYAIYIRDLGEVIKFTENSPAIDGGGIINHINLIHKHTQTIKNCAEGDLDYGTLKTLKMIDDEAEAIKQWLKEGGKE